MVVSANLPRFEAFSWLSGSREMPCLSRQRQACLGLPQTALVLDLYEAHGVEGVRGTYAGRYSEAPMLAPWSR
jgi:hypothetical protein